MATGDEYKRRKAQLELEEQIADAIKNSTASIETFAEAQKKVSENYKLIKKITSEITELTKLAATAKGKEKQILEAEIDSLKQQQKLLVGVNKELSKMKNLAKSVGNEMLNWGKELKDNFVPTLGSIFQSMLKIDDLTHQTANQIGFQGTKLALLKGNVNAVVSEYAMMGYSMEDAYKVQTSLSEATGRQIMLTKQATKALVESARITGMMPEDMANLTGQMEAFGLGAEQSTDFIFKMSKEASDMGLNSGKVIKKFQENLNLLNKLNFKNGIKGLKEMAKFSEKYKLDMNAVASVADKVFRPEGAIEAAAQLQVLGGSLAQLGDPFQLMYKARNSPEELAKSLTKAAVASATFDKTTKEWKVNAYELDRLKEAANALGMDYSQLVETAKQGAKIKQFEGILAGKGMDPKTMDAITGMAQMGENGAFVTVDGNPKLLKDLDATQAKLLVNQEKERAKIADTAKSLNNRIDEIKNKFIIAGVQLFDKLEPVLKDLLKFGSWLVDKINPATFIGLFAAMPILKLGWWFLQGQILGRGFNSVTVEGKEGLLGKLKGSKLNPMNWGKKGVMPETPSIGGGEIKTPGAGPLPTQTPEQMDKMGGSMSKLGGIASMSSGQLLAFGAAMLMVGGAIAIAALGLGELVKSFQGLTGEQVLGALGGLLIVMGGMAAMLYLLTTASTVAAIPLLAVGAAFLMIGGGIAIASLGLSVLVDSFVNMFKVIGDNGASLILAGIGFMSMAAGIGVLSMSLLALAGTSLLALPGLLMLGAVTSMLTDTATALQSTGGEGIGKTIDAINRVDTNKLEALKDLSMWMALLGGTTTIKFDEALHIDGSIEIAGEAGGKSNTDWVKDPIFLSKLKQLISEQTERDRNGGKGR